MRSMFANGVVLWGALIGLWLALAAASVLELHSAADWLRGAGAAGVVVVLCARLGLLGGQSWPDTVGQALGLLARRCNMALEGIWLTLLALSGNRRLLRPALVRFTLPSASPERGIFALSASMAPGLLSVSLDERGLYVHVLHEDDGDDEDLRALQSGPAPRVGP